MILPPVPVCSFCGGDHQRADCGVKPRPSARRPQPHRIDPVYTEPVRTLDDARQLAATLIGSARLTVAESDAVEMVLAELERLQERDPAPSTRLLRAHDEPPGPEAGSPSTADGSGGLR